MPHRCGQGLTPWIICDPRLTTTAQFRRYVVRCTVSSIKWLGRVALCTASAVLTVNVQAGKVWVNEDEGTAACLQFPEDDRSNLRGAAWRTSTEPGVRVRHPAAVSTPAQQQCCACCSRDGRRDQANDPIDARRVYGVTTQDSEHVVDVIEQEPKGVLEGLLRKHGEHTYLSTTREPLGKARIHSGDLPPRVTGDGYTFGMKSSESESAKPLLYPDAPGGAATEFAAAGGGSKVPEYTARYRGITGPGQQRTRGYDWSKTSIPNPNSHRFGRVDKGALRDGEGAAIALDPSRGAPPAPAIVAKRVADYRNVAVDHLGRVKSLGCVSCAPVCASML